MTTSASPAAADPSILLPADDPDLFELDLRGLRTRWAAAASRPPIGSEQMTGAEMVVQSLKDQGVDERPGTNSEQQPGIPNEPTSPAEGGD